MPPLQQAPTFDAAGAVRIVRDLYGFEARATALVSERDQNFRLDSERGRFILKIANAAETRAMLEAENAAMAHVAQHVTICPRLVPAADGREIVQHSGYFVRLLTWIDGTPLGHVRYHSQSILEDLGRRLGELDRALASFDHPAAHRAFHWDLAAALPVVHEHLPLVREEEWRRVVAREVEAIDRRRRALFATLRRSVIHGDANDYNVIANRGDGQALGYERVAGIVDFGDLVWSWSVADLAIALAYAVLDKRDPLASAAHIVRGFHQACPLQEAEVAALFDLVKLRLCQSVALAARQQRERPDDTYLEVSQPPIRRTLPRLISVPVGFAETAVREACGLDPSPRGRRVIAWLEGPGRSRVRLGVLDGVGQGETVVDLGVGSSLIDGDPRANAEPALTSRIAAVLAAKNAGVGIGRYGEARSLSASPLFGSADDRDERRTVHLGIDLFAPAGTAVCAPIAGVVHASADNAAPFDYGPVVILQHHTDDGDPFFTIYGHLSRTSLAGLEPGRRVEAGERLGDLGDPMVNGGWPPHLHFQLAVDLLGLGCDFPGICRASERSAWMALSPDPNVVLQQASHVPVPPVSSASLIGRRRSSVGRNVRLSYRRPLDVVRGWMHYLYDASGRRFLDAYNNVPHVGHCHPRVVAAAAEQMRVLNTNTRYLHETLAEYAERLIATVPSPLKVCYFVNSGSEANELALRLARAHTKRRDTIVLDWAYHGNTTSLVEISPYKFKGPGGAGRQPWVHVAPVPDVYRHRVDSVRADAGPAYAKPVAEMVDALVARGSGPAAFIAETCPSVAGQIVCPPGYLASVYESVRAAGGVCIADEVQTAFGRMGTSFYAFEDQRVVPDIVVLGKPIGNGYPLGAVVTSDEIASSFDSGMEFFSTFGGSTVSCAVGLAVLNVVRDEQLQDRAREVGERLLGLLCSLAARHPIVGDVRGSGLFFGVELVRDRRTLEAAPAEAEYVVNRLRDEGVLIGTEGPLHNVLKIRPPLSFGREDAEALAARLDDILGELQDL